MPQFQRIHTTIWKQFTAGEPSPRSVVSRETYLDGRLAEFRRRESLFARESRIAPNFAPNDDPEKKPAAAEQ